MSRLAQKRSECDFIDVRAFADLDVPHELPFAVQESHRILECGAAEKSELHMVGRGVDIGDRAFPSIHPLPHFTDSWSGGATRFDALGDRIEGRGSPDAVCSATDAALTRPADLDGWFYAAAGLARFGGEQGADRVVQNLAKLVSGGFFPYETLMKHPWLDGLRRRPDFLSILQQANDRHREAQAAFIESGGEALLGARHKDSPSEK